MTCLKKKILRSITPLLVCFYAYPTNIHNNNNFNVTPSKNLFSTIKKRLQKIKQTVANKCVKQYKSWFKSKTELSTNDKIHRFLDALTWGKISELMPYIQCPDLTIAEAVFSLLKKYWPWQRDYTFLIPNLDNNTKESDFIIKLRFDLMKIVEIDHITRADYIYKHTNTQSFQTILDYLEHCTLLQANADLNGLFNEINRLRNRVIKNGRKTIIADNICLAIAEKFYLDPVTKLLHTVKYAPTLKEAEEAYETTKKIMELEQAKGRDTTKYCSLFSDHLKVSLSAFLTSIQNKIVL